MNHVLCHDTNISIDMCAIPAAIKKTGESHDGKRPIASRCVPVDSRIAIVAIK
jgi:hypothetical protein